MMAFRDYWDPLAKTAIVIGIGYLATIPIFAFGILEPLPLTWSLVGSYTIVAASTATTYWVLRGADRLERELEAWETALLASTVAEAQFHVLDRHGLNDEADQEVCYVAEETPHVEVDDVQ